MLALLLLRTADWTTALQAKAATRSSHGHGGRSSELRNYRTGQQLTVLLQPQLQLQLHLSSCGDGTSFELVLVTW